MQEGLTSEQGAEPPSPLTLTTGSVYIHQNSESQSDNKRNYNESKVTEKTIGKSGKSEELSRTSVSIRYSVSFASYFTQATLFRSTDYRSIIGVS